MDGDDDNDDDDDGDEKDDRPLADGMELFGDIQTKLTHGRLTKMLFDWDAEPFWIGHYAMVGILGSGGMGMVWEAYDRKLGRKVALKLLNDAVTRVADMENRLQREAQALAQLSHPNVVTVYETGEYEGRTFISMEFVDGPTLDAFCRGLPWRKILEAYIAAGRGLAAAHAAGIVHRDFKPQNALVGQDGRVRVLDFGLARGADGAGPPRTGTIPPDSGASGSRSLMQPITRSGQVVGTPRYMSPEQCAGEAADERSDQFSFCVALYEALYGERPFLGKTTSALREAALAGRIRPAPSKAGVPPWLRSVLVRGLAGDPAGRHASMDDLIAALQRDPRARLLRVLAALLGVTVLVGMAWAWEAAVSKQEAAEFHAAQAEARREAAEQKRLDTDRRRRDALTMREINAVLPEDPTRAVAMLKLLSDRADAWRGTARMIASDAAYLGVARSVRLPTTERSPHGLSPDARWVVTHDAGKGAAHLLDLTSGGETVLAESNVAAPFVAFSPDAKLVAAKRSADPNDESSTDPTPPTVGIWTLGSGGYRSLGQVPDGHQFLRFSPDGKTLVSFGRDAAVYLWDVASGRLRVLEGHEDKVTEVRMSADGRQLASVDGYGILRRWDLPEHGDASFRELTGNPPIAFAPDGTLAAALGPGDVMLYPTGDADSDALVGLGAPLSWLEFSDDGGCLGAADDHGGVMVWDMLTQEPQRLPGHEEEITAMRFLHGHRFLVTSSIDNTLGIWDTQSPHSRRLRGHRGVAFWAVDDDHRQLVTLGWEGQVRRWDLPEEEPGPTPDHAGGIGAIAHGAGSTFVTGGKDGVVREWDGAAWHTITEHETAVSAVSYAPDGRALASGDTRGGVRLRRGDAPVQELPRGGVGEVVAASLSFSGDGETLAVAREEAGVTVHDLASGSVESFATMPFKPRWLVLDPEGRQITAVGWVRDGGWSIRVLDASDGQEVKQFDLLDDKPTVAAFSANGHRVAYGSTLRGVHVWDLETEVSRHLGDHSRQIHGMDIAMDGRTIATASLDGTIRLWDAETERSRTIELRQRDLEAVAFDPHGDSFAAGGGDHLVYVGRDDLPRDQAQLRAWLDTATTFTVDPQPLD
jgi:WD40 repeat protein/predicted Ser/Thr protein kinase